MSSIKRPRLTLAASDNTYVTPLNITNPTIVPGEQPAVDLLPHITHESTEIAPLSLMTLPVDVFILFTPYLAAQDILRLSHTGRYFHELLSSVSLYGSSVLDRNKALLQCGNPYDGSTQTLDLSYIPRQKKKPSLRQYVKYLKKITALVVNYRNWAKACIKTLIFPIEAMLKGDLTGSLSKITPLLSGLTHLHLFLSVPAAGSRVLYLTNDQRKIFLLNLKALQSLPVEKITIENSVYIGELPSHICTAIGQGYISSGIQHLIFRDSPTNTRKGGYTISLPNNGPYPRLTTLDLSQAVCSTIYIKQLPDTITCLCVNGSAVIEGSAPSIVRLEIRQDKDAFGNLEKLTKALPALKEVNISSSSLFYFSDVLLAILLDDISPDLYITVSALHIHRPTWLEEVYAKFKGRFRLPQEVIFHLYLPDEVAAFSRLARQGVFNHLTKIQYQTEEIMDPSTFFINTVVSLLQEGQLPQMNYFICYQQYDPLKYEEAYKLKVIGLKAASPLPFAESMEGKLLLLQSKHQFILQNVFPQKSLDVLLNYFLDSSQQLLKYIDDTKRAELSRTLQPVLAQTIKTWQSSLTEKEYTYAQLKTTLEILYLCLYSAYFQHFRRSIFSSFLKDHKKLFQTSFFETQLGQDINNHLQTIILAETAKLVSQQISLQFAEVGLTAQPIISNSTGFTLTFAKQSF